MAGPRRYTPARERRRIRAVPRRARVVASPHRHPDRALRGGPSRDASAATAAIAAELVTVQRRRRSPDPAATYFWCVMAAMTSSSLLPSTCRFRLNSCNSSASELRS